MPTRKLSQSLYQVEVEPIKSPSSSDSRHFQVEDENVVSIDFEGATLEDIRKLQKNLLNADNEQDVIRTALEILALADGKDIIIEGGGKRWRIRDLWRK